MAWLHLRIPVDLYILFPVLNFFFETTRPFLFCIKSFFIKPPLVFSFVPRQTWPFVPIKDFFATIFPLNSIKPFLVTPFFVFEAFPAHTEAREPTFFFKGLRALRRLTVRRRLVTLRRLVTRLRLVVLRLREARRLAAIPC